MRSRRRPPGEYRRTLKMSGEEWLRHLYGELMARESMWMGTPALKNPLDAWVYQEILHDVRPEVVVELGSAFGGGTLFLANMLDLIGAGQVVTVDHHHERFRVEHPRIGKITGDTHDPEVIERVRGRCEGQRTLVIHDAAHEADAALADLRNYAGLVSSGSYLIVEDGVQDLLTETPGPMVAVERFLAETDDFEIDAGRERFLLTYNPHGFLLRR